jgi:2-polyprenyl-6-methoxyphenol hydroxylase-like FAD-dependent oxidoreductase
MRALEIAVCGAGIGGLAISTLLSDAGHAVTLFERFEKPQPIGAGLMLQPTGLAALERLDLRRRIETLGRRITGIEGQTATGRRIFDMSYADLDATMYAVGIHRGALFQCLYDRARKSPVTIKTDTLIAASTLTHDRRNLYDNTGRLLGAFDLVIDGTGLTSALRRAHSITYLDRPNPYGAMWGVVLEADHAPSHRLAQVYDRAAVMIGLLPIGCLPDDPVARTAVFWSVRANDIPQWQSQNFAAWQTQVGKLWPAAIPYVSQFRSHADLSPARYTDLRLKHPFAERLAFLGDSARAASPQLGQGANLVLIDAVCLADALAHTKSVPEALLSYAAIRRSHTRFYSYASRILTPFFQSDSKTAPRVRDAVFGPMARIPYLRREMIRTLAGLKTGLFSHQSPAAFVLNKF